MSETTGAVVIIVGLAISAVGFLLMVRSQREVLGFAIIVVGFMLAGTGMLTIEDTVVEERTPVTLPTSAATPAS
ncbi:MAG TPA: hypothetical protein VGR22_09690 [Thermomicrobiales bacterium]|nr:hypothetical protein [Thermomicrobiales bacterium]